MPGPHAIALIVVTLATFYLYTRAWIRIELVSLLLLLALVVMFYVVPFGEETARLTDVEIFEAFGSAIGRARKWRSRRSARRGSLAARIVRLGTCDGDRWRRVLLLLSFVTPSRKPEF